MVMNYVIIQERFQTSSECPTISNEGVFLKKNSNVLEGNHGIAFRDNFEGEYTTEKKVFVT